MTYLLFPGRHHLLTNFQLEYLTLACGGAPTALRDVEGQPLPEGTRIEAIVWAITSANHSNTRRNPLPAHRREAAIEELADLLDVESYVYLIDDIGDTPNFAEYVLKKIEVDSHGRLLLTPENTVVGCSTPAVIAMYERLGFRILPFELIGRAPGSEPPDCRHSVTVAAARPPACVVDEAGFTYRAETPWQVLEQIVHRSLESADLDWRTDEVFLTKIARATRRLYLKYDFGDQILELFRRPLLTDDGDLTATRDYNTYVRAFDDGAQRKYAQIKDYIRPGRIVDIGCCTGSLIREMTLDDRLRESDFYGIEVARPLYAECQHRKEQRAFANDNVFFYQRDFAAGPIFPPHSVNTFTTLSLTHEIESYAGREALWRFLDLLHQQLTPRGRWINFDVVGPEQPETLIWMRLNRDDGRHDDVARQFGPEERAACREYLSGLSTYGRFLRFAHDFRREAGYSLPHERDAARPGLVRLSLRDAAEFLSKKDYVDNWQSEMHETFCFWTFADWQAAVVERGFRVHPASHALVNPWIVAHRYEGKAELFTEQAGQLLPLPYPVTNMVLVAEKVSTRVPSMALIRELTTLSAASPPKSLTCDHRHNIASA